MAGDVRIHDLQAVRSLCDGQLRLNGSRYILVWAGADQVREIIFAQGKDVEAFHRKVSVTGHQIFDIYIFK